jgi:hypothetical protein
MNISDQDPDPKRTNPMADSWKPEDKAAESAFENPEEFDVRHPATKDSTAPLPLRKDENSRRNGNPGTKVAKHSRVVDTAKVISLVHRYDAVPAARAVDFHAGSGHSELQMHAF